MPAIFVTVNPAFEPGQSPGTVKITGFAQESGANFQIGWEVTVNYADNANAINSAIVNAAVAEFARANPPVIVAGGDRKALFGGVA